MIAATINERDALVVFDEAEGLRVSLPVEVARRAERLGEGVIVPNPAKPASQDARHGTIAPSRGV